VIVDGRAVPSGTTVGTDICVVGAGPAGISIALRLADEPLRVCLLESGGMSFDEEAQTLAQADNEGLPYYPLKESRLRCFGGTTLSWGGVCAPLDEWDHEARSWVPDSGWPFARRALDEYMPAAFRLCEIGSGDPEKGSLSTNGSDGQAPQEEDPDAGGDMRVGRVFFGPPTRFGRRYEAEIRSAENVTVYLNTTAIELELGSDGLVSNLKAGCLAGSRFSVRARHYVLAAGGVENPRLLLVSDRLHAAGIGNAHGLVGRCFMEHPRVVNRYRLPSDGRALARLVSGASGTLAFSRLTLAPRVQKDEELLQYHANLKFGFVGQDSKQWQAVRRLAIVARRPWRDSPYFQDAGGGRTGVRWKDIRSVLARPDRSFVAALGAATRWRRLRRFVEVTSSLEQRPLAANRVELVSGRDALGVRRVRLRWNVGEAEERTYRRGLELVLKELGKLAPGIGVSPLEDQDQWPSGIIGTWHHMGTTRMHDDPKRGVVDADCRVHGVGNLFVAGSSVFPTVGSVSPTVTIVALSLRLADHLRSTMT
jgi:choline dehydrogenase-like flavoprotein